MTEKIKITQLIVVEGKYDKIKLSSLIDGLIIATNGFRIYKDKEKTALIKALAKKQGVIILTDSDKAGFQLRGYLKSILGELDSSMITELYIPQIKGKEQRKEIASKEGYLGVEGIDSVLLRELLSSALSKCAVQKDNPVTKADFFSDGLSGGENSSKNRQAFLKELSLPSYVTANSLLKVINSLLTRQEYENIINKIMTQ